MPTTQPNLVARLAVSAKIRTLRHEVAEAVTEEFFERHPDWLLCYGAHSKAQGIEDVSYHLDFLAGAVEAGSAGAFGDYVRWAANRLAVRGIAASFLAGSLTQLAAALRERLDPAENGVALPVLEAGLHACAIETVPAADRKPQRGIEAGAPNVFLKAILNGEKEEAVKIAFETLRSGVAPADIYVDVFQAALCEVGSLWETGRISVSVEHSATAITQYVLTQMYSQIKAPRMVTGRAVIAVVSGDLHQVGANMVADMLDAHGWDTRFLGNNVPHQDILQAVVEHDADVLGISATMLLSVPQVISLIGAVRENSRNHRPRIVVGGSSFRLAPNLWQEIGADGVATDLRGAVLTFQENLLALKRTNGLRTPSA